MMNQGILYKVTGKKYVDEAEVSARSAKEQMPDIETALVTDTASYESEVFDHVVQSEPLGQGYSCKLPVPRESPFKRTLFLDTDTYVVADISSVS